MWGWNTDERSAVCKLEAESPGIRMLPWGESCPDFTKRFIYIETNILYDVPRLIICMIYPGKKLPVKSTFASILANSSMQSKVIFKKHRWGITFLLNVLTSQMLIGRDSCCPGYFTLGLGKIRTTLRGLLRHNFMQRAVRPTHATSKAKPQPSSQCGVVRSLYPDLIWAGRQLGHMEPPLRCFENCCICRWAERSLLLYI